MISWSSRCLHAGLAKELEEHSCYRVVVGKTESFKASAQYIDRVGGKKSKVLEEEARRKPRRLSESMGRSDPLCLRVSYLEF